MFKAAISSNQWFGALNRRFDRRARLLHRLGYKYTRSPLGAVFVRGFGHRLESISAAVVMSGQNCDFIEAVRCPVCVRLGEFEGLAARLHAVASGSRVSP